jgi:hypothetical protein
MPDEVNETQNPTSNPEVPANQQPDPAPSANAPEPTPAKTASAPTEQSSTVVLVWQWLTYGLWSWTLASLGILLSSTLAYFIASASRDGGYTWQIYIIATALCLLPISYLIDRTYSKHEPAHKHGFAAVILVLHAVLAFLVSIGALITAVVTLLSLATDASGDTPIKTTVIISALLIALLGGLFFARIVRPAKLEAISRRFGLIVSVIAAVTIIAALAGPYASTIQTKSDRQIESGLYGVNTAIQDYARNNKKLPANLSDLTFDSYAHEAKQLVKDNLVSYSAKGETTTSGTYATHTFKYELCVTYKKSKGSGKAVPAHSSFLASDTYSSSYLDTYSHPAGHTCYQQSTYVTDTIPASVDRNL